MLPQPIITITRKSALPRLVNRGSSSSQQVITTRRKTTTTTSTTTTSWVRSRLLQRTLPLLTHQFNTYQNEHHQFPIFDAHQTKKAFQPFQTNKTTTNTSQQTTPPKTTTQQAAILIPLLSMKEEPYILFTLRSSTIKSHPSQISFPGGHKDDGIDTTLIETALRETQEEIMMDSTYPPLKQLQPQQPQSQSQRRPTNDYEDGIHIMGTCTAVPSVKGTPVTPVLGVFQYDIPYDPRSMETTVFSGYNPEEVEKVFAVSLQELLDCETSETLPRLGSHAPVFPTRHHGKIWGLTAFCLRPVLHKILKPVFCP